MSFVDSYLSRVGSATPLSDQVKDNLASLEQELNEKMEEHSGSFDSALKTHGAEIADLVTRVGAGIKNAKLSFGTVRWVINIAIEVYQIVDRMYDSYVKPEMSSEQLHEKKIDFGKDLTYFVWMTIDPLAKYLKWLPLRKTVERWLIKWLAGYALNATVDLLAANESVVAMSDSKRARILRAVR